MSRKNWGWVFAGIGLSLSLLALLADSVGIGGTAGFGFAQIAALVIGIIMLLIGLFLAFGSSDESTQPAMKSAAATSAPRPAEVSQPMSAASSPVTPPAAAPAPAATETMTDAFPAAPGAGAKDDLTKLEGIGPKLQDVLHNAGFMTFAALASASPEAITSAVKASGFKPPFDASSWPEQAALAAKGDWAGLDALQASLMGGRK